MDTDDDDIDKCRLDLSMLTFIHNMVRYLNRRNLPQGLSKISICHAQHFPEGSAYKLKLFRSPEHLGLFLMNNSGP